MAAVTPPSKPFGLRQDHICKASTTLKVKQEDHSEHGRDYTVSDQDGSLRFEIEGKKSKAFQRDIKDASGPLLYELRRNVGHLDR